MKFFNELPIRVDTEKLTFSELATILMEGREFNLKGGVSSSVEGEFIKKGILKSNMSDLKKLAELDPKGKMLAALKKTGMIRRYQIK